MELEDARHVAVASFETTRYRDIQRLYVRLGDSEDARHQQIRARHSGQRDFVAGKVGLGEHTTSVRQQPMARAFNSY
jgi:hypothetical protein